jgi:hypothetical protein
MQVKIDNLTVDPIEVVVDRAHGICNQMLLFEAISMDEDEIRLVLGTHHLTDETIQNTYLQLVREYDRQTGGQVV